MPKRPLIPLPDFGIWKGIKETVTLIGGVYGLIGIFVGIYLFTLVVEWFIKRGRYQQEQKKDRAYANAKAKAEAARLSKGVKVN